MKAKLGECVYCGHVGPLTIDHVPPQSFCGKPRPSDLVKVPSCKTCNEGASMDDEYFKTMMVFKERAGDHPEALLIRDSVFRGLAKPQKKRFTSRILDAVRHVERTTPSGIYVGNSAAYDVDLTRLDRVVSRVTRGLYWHHHHSRLPNNYKVIVWSEHGLRGITSADAQHLRTTLVDPILKNSSRSIGRAVLQYWYASGDREHMTGWLFQFFGDVRFIAFTVPEPSAANRGHVEAVP